MVGILFCFMNGEVKAEIIKKWKRWRMMHNMQQRIQLHTLASTQRTSVGSEAESLPRDRQLSMNSIYTTPSPEELDKLLTDRNQNVVKFCDETKELVGTATRD